MPCASASFATHWFAPPGLLLSSHSYPNRLRKKLLSHWIGVWVQIPSRPLVQASPPTPEPDVVAPAEALRLQRRRLGVGADVVVGDRAVGLAERVAAGDQRDRLLVVHRHPRERLTDVTSRRGRVRVAVGTLRVDVDQSHLHGAERLGEVTVAAVALIVQPDVLRTPVDVLGRPGVLAAAAEAEGLEAHRLERDVAGQDHQVGPRDLVAVLLLDRPQQPPGLVERDVVGPAVERREPLGAGTAAAAAVGDPVGARAVPRHPDEQRAIVAPVRRPPRLRGGHQLRQVLPERVEVELLERLGVVEVRAQRVGPVQHLQVELVGPPVLVSPAVARVDDRALALSDSHVCCAPFSFLVYVCCVVGLGAARVA